MYVVLKQFLATVESIGLPSLNVVQAAILIAIYEVSNAIYPAAYLSTYHFSRLGYALGLHNRQAPQTLIKLTTWSGNEELRRSRYAVMILEST